MILALSVTQDCNLSCRYCGGIERAYNGQETKKTSYEELCNLLEIGRKGGIKSLVITGGEPFVRKDIFEIIEYGAELGYTMSILTNGTLISRDVAKKISQISHIAQVRISMESSRKKGYEYYRGKETYEKVIAGIRNLNRYNIPTGIGFTAYPENIDNIGEMVNLCVEEGISFIRIIHGVSTHRAKNLYFGKEFAKQIIKRIMDAILSSGYATNSISSSTPIDIISGKECPAGKYYFFIDSSGRMVPCPFIPEQCNDITRIEKVRSIEDFRNLKNHMVDLSERVYHNLRGKCRDCKLNKRCKGGCFTEKLTKGFGIYDEQPICVKEILEDIIKESRHAGEMDDILDFWVYYAHLWKVPEMPHMFCMRQLPLWTIPLKNPF